METKFLTADEFDTLLANASTTEDFKKIAGDVIVVLRQSEEDLGDALDQIGEMSRKLDLQEANKDSQGIIVAIDGDDYLLIGNRFITRKGEMNADKLSKDAELLGEMLKSGSGSLITPKQPGEKITDGLTS